MHIQSIQITNLKLFAELKWQLDANIPANGWHVILGPNGSGKSSFVRAIAAALIGLTEVSAARLKPTEWTRFGQTSGQTDVWILTDQNYDLHADMFKTVALRSFSYTRVGFGSAGPAVLDEPNTTGWFSAGFGPFRRFTGGNSDLHALYSSHPRLARHLSIFGEDVALTEALSWLKNLRFKQLESQGEYNLLNKVKSFINQDGFLPFSAKLVDVNSEQVVFEDGAGVQIPVLELSDGYRSVLSLTFELIRQMAACFPGHELFDETGTQIIIPGVVLIDEVDVHLHPNWQRKIGPWLCRLFPQVQFIVTTHSPFVCQEATSVWRLPDPDSDDEFKRVTGEELTRLRLGDATLALETHAFGLEQNRSDRANALLDELAGLNSKAASGQLNKQEAQRRQELKTLLQPVLL